MIKIKVIIFSILASLSSINLSSVSNHHKLNIMLKEEKQVKEIFKEFHNIYEKHKVYEIDSDHGLKRYQIFEDNLKRISEENKKSGLSIYGITHLADMTSQEIQQQLLKTNPLPQNGIKISKPTEKFIKFLFEEEDDDSKKLMETVFKNEDKYKAYDYSKVKEIDWRNTMSNVKDQGMCGSCWAFASIAALESHLKIKQNINSILSEQYLLNCDDVDNACNGGWPANTYEWMKNNGALEDKHLPYEHKKNSCNMDLKEKALKIVEGSDNCEGDCNRDAIFKLLENGPIVTAMDASSEMIGYYLPPSIDHPFRPDVSKDCKSVNHAVTIVGVKHVNNECLLIVRNSWSDQWGVNGYFSIPCSSSCFMLDFGFSPKVKSTTNNSSPNTINKNEEEKKKSEVESNCPTYIKDCNTNKSFSSCENILEETIKGFIPNEENLFLFYEDKNCKGSYTKKFFEAQCFEEDFNNLPSSINHFKSVVRFESSKNPILFTNYCFTGKSIEVNSKISSLDFDLCSIKSINFSDNFAVYSKKAYLAFYEEINFKGKVYEVELDMMANIDDSEIKSFCSKIKSIKKILK